jgi:hypothetical protein
MTDGKIIEPKDDNLKMKALKLEKHRGNNLRLTQCHLNKQQNYTKFYRDKLTTNWSLFDGTMEL